MNVCESAKNEKNYDFPFMVRVRFTVGVGISLIISIHYCKGNVHSKTNVCVFTGLVKKEEQLRPTQKYLAVRYVGKVCLYLGRDSLLTHV